MRFALKIILLFSVLFVFASSCCCADDIQFEASVDRNKVPLGEYIELSLIFRGTQHATSPDLSKIENFEARYIGPSSMTSIVNGKVSSSITFIYNLIPIKTGTFDIGPFSVNIDNKTYTSNHFSVEVLPAQQASLASPSTSQTSIPAASGQPGSSQSQESLKDKIFLVMKVPKTNVYLNELIPVSVKLYVSQLAIRDIQYPQLKAEGFYMEAFTKPAQYQEVINGVSFDVVEFTTRLFPTRVGDLTLEPAAMKCSILLRKSSKTKSGFDSFFGDDFFDGFTGGYQSYPVELKSENFNIVSMDLPSESKPADFKGAIGKFSLEVSASPLDVKVGDPITLKISVFGEGNFGTVNCPEFKTKDGFKLYEPTSAQVDNSKIFEQVLIPSNENITEIPKLTFSYFDTDVNAYKTLTKGPIPIKVQKSDSKQDVLVFDANKKDINVKTTQPDIPEKLGEDIIYIKESIGKLYPRNFVIFKTGIFWLLNAAILFIFLVTVLTNRRIHRLRNDKKYARLTVAFSKAKKGINNAKSFMNHGNSNEFYYMVSNVLKEYLGDKFNIASASITVDIIEDFLKPRGIDGHILVKMRNIFEECDMVKYASSLLETANMQRTLENLEEIVNYFERVKKDV